MVAPRSRTGRGRRRGRVVGAVAVALAIAAVSAGFVGWSSRRVSQLTRPGEVQDVTIDDDSSLLRVQAVSEGWFDACTAASSALAGMGAAVSGRVIERLSDVVPTGPVEQYRVGYSGPVSPVDIGLRSWLRAGLEAGDAVEGWSATFNDGPAGPGGWSVHAFRLPSAAAARLALRRVYTAHVCHFGADPWHPSRLPGVVGAVEEGEDVSIYWTTADLLVLVDWSVYQPLDEARARAASAASAVRAHLSG